MPSAELLRLGGHRERDREERQHEHHHHLDEAEVEVGLRLEHLGAGLGAAAIAEAPQLVEVELVGLARAAAAELVDDRQGDGQIVAVERQGARGREPGVVLDQPALGQAEKDGVGIVGGEEDAVLGGGGDARALLLGGDEDAVELGAAALAAVDAQGELAAEIVELADLDRGAEGARLQFEAQALVAIMGVGLEIADDEQVERGQRHRIEEGHAKQAAVADPDAAKRVELGRQGQLAEGEEDAEHQADGDSEAEIFGEQVGEHSPHHAQGPAGLDHVLEKPQHLVEDEQHRRQDQRADERHRDLAGEVAVDQLQSRQMAPSFGRKASR